MGFVERQMERMTGVKMKDFKDWTIKAEVARRNLVKVCDHFDTHKTMTKEQFEQYAQECNEELDVAIKEGLKAKKR